MELVSLLATANAGRQVQARLPRVAKLLEWNYGSALVHPTLRSLKPLVDRCGSVAGQWELDTEGLALEHALARGAATGRGPGGDSVTDRELTSRKDVLLASLDEVCVTIHQELPADTV